MAVLLVEAIATTSISASLDIFFNKESLVVMFAHFVQGGLTLLV
jgi:hypothetical protein